MKLGDYLAKQNMNARDFARKIGKSDSTLCLLLRGDVWVSRDTAQKIYDATDGKVTPTDFLIAHKRRRAARAA